MHKGIDNRGYKYGHEEDEHANLLSHPFLHFVQISEIKVKKFETYIMWPKS